MKRKVLIGPSTFGAIDMTPLNKLKESGFEVKDNPYGRKLNQKELLELLPGVFGLIAGLETLDREVLEKSELKVISRCGAGLNNVDLKAANELDIKVYSTPDAPTQAVAELTVGSLLALLRSIPQMDRDMHKSQWAKKIGGQLKGKTVVVIGFGRIGRRVAELLRVFEVKIIIVDPAVKSEVTTLEQALPVADIITLHVSGEDEILGKKELGSIKKGAYLLNSSRGGVVNETALIEALDSGRLAGAWLDTFTEEPYQGPLTKYDQVILTPHVGSYTAECRSRMEEETVNNLIAGFNKLEGG